MQGSIRSKLTGFEIYLTATGRISSSQTLMRCIILKNPRSPLPSLLGSTSNPFMNLLDWMHWIMSFCFNMGGFCVICLPYMPSFLRYALSYIFKQLWAGNWCSSPVFKNELLKMECCIIFAFPLACSRPSCYFFLSRAMGITKENFFLNVHVEYFLTNWLKLRSRVPFGSKTSLGWSPIICQKAIFYVLHCMGA